MDGVQQKRASWGDHLNQLFHWLGKQDEQSAVLIQDDQNRFYFTGFHSSNGTLLVSGNDAWLILDGRSIEDARKAVQTCKILEQELDLKGQIRCILNKNKVKKLFVNSDAMTVMQIRGLMASLSPEIMLVDSNALYFHLRSLRMRKDNWEVECHRKAQQITDRAFYHICDIIRPGMTEIDVAKEIGFFLTENGSDDRTFNFIVASGPNGSLPHGFASHRVIEKGDMVTMDFGAVYHGYYADMTRTVAIGNITSDQRKVYETVREAQKRAFDKICRGAVCRDIDTVARNYISEKGYGKYFHHRLGHSLGVAVHEYPFFDQECDERLQPGMVITVEPGIYIPGKMGVRIEDMIHITDNGFENLCQCPSALIML